MQGRLQGKGPTDLQKETSPGPSIAREGVCSPICCDQLGGCIPRCILGRFCRCETRRAFLDDPGQAEVTKQSVPMVIKKYILLENYEFSTTRRAGLILLL